METNFKEVARVYATHDYDAFKEMKNNRDVREDRVAKLYASLSEKEILNPIVVNEKMEIVDGQGRFEALKRLDREIKFVIANGTDVEDCRRMNAYNTAWKPRDFVVSYKNSGNENYTLLEDVHNELGVGYSVVLASAGISKQFGMNKLRQGSLLFTQDHAKQAENVVKTAFELKKALDCRYALTSEFFSAVRVLLYETKGYDHERMMKKCHVWWKKNGSFEPTSKIGLILKQFSDIYNTGATKTRIYFEDYMRNKGNNVRSYDEQTTGHYKTDVSAKTLQ